MKAPRVLLMLLALMSGCASSTVTPETQSVRFEVRHEVLGPAAEVWTYRYTGGYGADVRISYLGGDLSGTFYASPEFLESVRAAAEAQKFFELPTNMSSRFMQIDGPSMQVSLTIGKREHTVGVSAPDALADDPEFQRLLVVMHAITSFMPLQPKEH